MTDSRSVSVWTSKAKGSKVHKLMSDVPVFPEARKFPPLQFSARAVCVYAGDNLNGSDHKTVRERSEVSFTEKHSEFIGYISPAATEEEAIAFIGEIRSRHRKATHNVYAYILRENSASRYSDDGEPQGTAGVPVLEVLKKEGVTDVCCVVTRYFGGILLGGGGLVRAYSHSAKLALDAAGIKVMRRCRSLTVKTDYSLYGKITHILPDFEVKTADTVFAENVELSLLVKEGLADDFTKKLIDISGGKAEILSGDIVFEELPS